MTNSPRGRSGSAPNYRLISRRSLVNARAVAALTCLLTFASLSLLLSRTSAIARNDLQQPPQITIGGVVVDKSGRPISDVALLVTGSRRASTLTGPEGTYAISLPMGGTYKVTPNRYDITFQPPELSFSNVVANISNVNFVGTQVGTFRVSGTILDSAGRPSSDVVIRVSDSPQVLTLSGPTGFYTFDHLTAGVSYTLRPSKAGATFEPPTFTTPSLSRDLSGINFVQVPQDQVRISGMVTDSLGQPLPDVIVGLSGAEPALANTGAAGGFAFTVPSGGNYLVAPAREGYTFTPSSLTFSSLTQNQSAANFIGSPARTFTISGVIIDSSGAPMLDVSVVMIGSSSGTVPTGPLGNYSFTVLASGTYTIAPSVPGMAFIPPSRTLGNLSSDQTGINFVGSATTGRPADINPSRMAESEPSPSPSPSPSTSPKVRPTPEPTPSPEATPKDLEKKNAQKSERDATTPTPPGTSSKTASEKRGSVTQKRLRSRRTRLRKRGVSKVRRSKRSPLRALKHPGKKNAKGRSRKTR